jgi:hypothetical protein
LQAGAELLDALVCLGEEVYFDVDFIDGVGGVDSLDEPLLNLTQRFLLPPQSSQIDSQLS